MPENDNQARRIAISMHEREATSQAWDLKFEDAGEGWACNARNIKTFAQHASISFLSPVEAGEKLVAEAREEAAVGRTGVYTVRVTAGDGRTVAIFQGLSRTAGGAVIEEENKNHD